MSDALKIIPTKPARPNRKLRGTTTQRGYGWEHQQQRARLLRERPICERCGDGWSFELHHKDRNPFNRDAANIVMLCERCHDQEHAGEAGT